MADPIKVIGAEIALTTANTVSNASLVRIINTDASNNATITIKNANSDVTGSFTLGAVGSDASCEFIVKQPTDTIEVSNTTLVKAVSVAYR